MVRAGCHVSRFSTCKCKYSGYDGRKGDITTHGGRNAAAKTMQTTYATGVIVYGLDSSCAMGDGVLAREMEVDCEL